MIYSSMWATHPSSKPLVYLSFHLFISFSFFFAYFAVGHQPPPCSMKLVFVSKEEPALGYLEVKDKWTVI